MGGLGLVGCSDAASEGADTGSGVSSYGSGEESEQDSSTSEESEGDSSGYTDSDGSGGLDLPGEGCEQLCDPFDPMACAEGEKCMPAACEPASGNYDTHVCRPVWGDKQVDEACTSSGRDGYDDCAAGLVCWGTNGAGEGHCKALCGGSSESPSCEDERFCARFGVAKTPLCVSPCDPLSQDCELLAEACLPLSAAESFACLPGPIGGGSEYGEPCEFANACAPGHLCINGSRVPEPGCAETQKCCSPLCDLADPTSCPGNDQICVGLEPSLNIGADWANVGMCALPQ